MYALMEYFFVWSEIPSSEADNQSDHQDVDPQEFVFASCSGSDTEEAPHSSLPTPSQSPGIQILVLL